jgi:hypothetical protein
VSIEREIEWSALMMMFPKLKLDEIDTSYSLIIDLCEHFNKTGRPDLWKDWLSLNLAEKGDKLEFSRNFNAMLDDEFGINGDYHE